ncbi:MAG: expansin-like protein [Desulfobacteraceae bacterium]|jgi:expansin (peptidoglycan-binding protein)
MNYPIQSKQYTTCLFKLLFVMLCVSTILLTGCDFEGGQFMLNGCGNRHTTDDGSDDTTDYTSDDVTDSDSNDTTDYTSDDATDSDSDDTTDYTSDDATDSDSDDTTDYTSDDATDSDSDDTTDYTSDDTTDSDSDDTTDYTSDDATSSDSDNSETEYYPELPEECSGSCNSATPIYPTIYEDGGVGNVTMYTTAPSSGGACNYGDTNVMSFAAMSVNVEPGDGMGHWQAGKICGRCAEVTAVTSQGPKTVVVRIMDKCPDAYCGIDLGGSAPGEVMVDNSGRYDGQWRFVSCEGHPEVSDGDPSLDVMQGTNSWWSRVHVSNGKTAVESIDYESDDGSVSGTFPYATDPENAYEVPTDEVLQSSAASFLITVTYIDGSTATVTLTPNQLSTEQSSYPLD